MHRTANTVPRTPRNFRYQRSQFPWRAGFYALVLVYLSLDLYVFHGPAARWLGVAGDRGTVAEAQGWAARVYGQPITLGELDRAVAAHLALRGAMLDEYPPGQSRLALQVNVLEDLIADRVLATWAKDSALAVGDAEVDAELDRARAGFGSPGEFDRLVVSAGSSTPLIRSQVRMRLAQSAWVEEAVRGASPVSDAEVEDGFASGHVSATYPPVIRVRHLVLAPSDRNDRRAEIEELHARVMLGAVPLARLAERHSDDLASARDGGDLGFFSMDRAPAGFAEAVWDLPDGALSKPFETAAGWHLAEVIERVPARPVSFADAETEIRARLESARRSSAVSSVRDQLVSRPARNIDRFYTNLSRPRTLPAGESAPQNPDHSDQ